MTPPAPATAIPSALPSSDASSPAKAWLRAIERTAEIETQPDRLLADVIDAMAVRFGDRPALLSDGECLSFAGLAARVHRYARWALSVGVVPGDRIALVMGAQPDYLAAWIGITQVGGVVALINSQLAGASLAHCLAVAEARHAIVARDLLPAVTDAAGRTGLQIWIHDGPGGSGLDATLAGFDGGPLRADERPAVTTADRALLIYTSGTTGLPKAAHVSHHRILSWSFWFAGLMNASPEDRLYDCLPLHHSVGGVVATGSMLVAGGSVVIVEKFSARRFWDDVVRWDCTVFQYIGELCRYLLKAPSGPHDRAHRLRLACGNGLRGDVWEPFRERFAIPRILEFYAATEGNFSLYNVEGEPGAIGRIPAFLAHRFPAAIVRFDRETGRPERGPDGLCIPCRRGEAGEAIGRIGGTGGGRFEGYTGAAETEAKILRDVLKPGDAWFRTGDLMMIDAKGFYRFVDRIGDTFRWKGENVATSEVAAVLAAEPGVVEANVYGVEVPGADGRAGMAALVVEDGFDLAALHARVARDLPAYARPVFLRLCGALDITETFKQKKQDLVRDGFDPAAIADPLRVDPDGRGYVVLDADLHVRIVSGALRL